MDTCTIAAANDARDSRKGDHNVRHNMPLVVGGKGRPPGAVARSWKAPDIARTRGMTRATRSVARVVVHACLSHSAPELVRPPYLASITGTLPPSTWRRPKGNGFQDDSASPVPRTAGFRRDRGNNLSIHTYIRMISRAILYINKRGFELNALIARDSQHLARSLPASDMNNGESRGPSKVLQRTVHKRREKKGAWAASLIRICPCLSVERTVRRAKCPSARFKSRRPGCEPKQAAQARIKPNE
jgi:hypothetical protein